MLTFKRDHHRLFSHHGYVNTMLLVRGLVESAPTEEVLLSGAGDGVVKVWRLGEDGSTTPTQIAKLQNGDPVLSIAVDGSLGNRRTDAPKAVIKRCNIWSPCDRWR